MKMFSSLAFAILASLIVVGTASAVPIITNGSFEDDGNAFDGGAGYHTLIGHPANPTGWTFGGDIFTPFNPDITLAGVNTSSQPFASGTLIPDGTHAAFLQVFGSTVSTTTMSTTITDLVVGGTYFITYEENARGVGPVVDSFVTLDAATIVASHGISHIASPSAYNTVTSSIFTATGTTASLNFTHNNAFAKDRTLLIDNVQIFVATPLPAPEPSTFALLALGLAGIGFSRRRNRH